MAGNGQDPVIKPLEQATVREALQDLGFTPSCEEEGVFKMGLRVQAAKAYALTFFSLEGRKNGVLVVRARILDMPPKDGRELLELANAWNRNHRWPRASVVGEELALDHQLDVTEGITLKQLRRFLYVVIQGMAAFLEWLEGVVSWETSPPHGSFCPVDA